MLIDWFTVAAQIVNFLVLVWLLKHFLYGRIIRAIQTRESRIAASLAEAAAKEQQAEQQLALYQAKLAEFEQQQASLLAQAKLDAEKQHTELIEKAREQVRALETTWQEELDRERSAFLLDLRRRAATEILAIARKTVADLASIDVQECAVQVFLEKVRLLDREAWRSLAAAEILVRSAIDLPEDTRAEIRETIETRAEAPVSLRFERAPELGLGLELRGNGRRIGWNSGAYLEALEEDLKEALEHAPAGAP